MAGAVSLKRPRTRLAVTAMAVIAIASVIVVLVWRRPTTLGLDDQHFVAATLELEGSPAVRAEVNDVGAIRSMTELLDLAAPTDPHPCVELGRLTLKRADGSRLSIDILPGHDSRFFEYRSGRVYRHIRRSEFLAAVAPFGVPDERFAGPESAGGAVK